MIFNHVKLDRAVIFINYDAGVVFLAFLPNTLNWNKMMLPLESNLFNLLELVKKSIKEDFLRNCLTLVSFVYNLSVLKVNVLEANNSRIEKK